MACDFLILGADGQVGWELQRAVAILGTAVSCTRQECDLSDLDQVRSVVHQNRPAVILNAAAYTAVDKAETDTDLANIINGDAVAALADETAKLGALLVHYSTDYVFDGTKSARYVENDSPNPQSAYGSSKLAGETAILRSGTDHFIFRTSWVYSVPGGNFANTILRLSAERESLNIIDDQIGAPTSAELIADTTAACLRTWLSPTAKPANLSGIYNLTAGGETSWHGFARELVKLAHEHNIKLKVTPEEVHPIPTKEYPLPAKRPANSRLNTEKLTSTFGLVMPEWQHHVRRFVTEVANKKD